MLSTPSNSVLIYRKRLVRPAVTTSTLHSKNECMFHWNMGKRTWSLLCVVTVQFFSPRHTSCTSFLVIFVAVQPAVSRLSFNPPTIYSALCIPTSTLRFAFPAGVGNSIRRRQPGTLSSTEPRDNHSAVTSESFLAEQGPEGWLSG